MIHFLVKIFSEKGHAEKFLRGELYARRLSWFKRIEGDDGRGDEYEAAIMPRRENLLFTLESRDILTGKVEKHTIPPEDLAAPLLIQPRHFDDVNLFCMYAAHSGDFEQVSEDNIQDYRRQLDLPGDCLKLGRYAVVITNTPEFVKRVKMAAHREGYRICKGLVRYYDPEVGTQLPPLNIGIVFNKREEYSYQREFRFAFDTGTSGSEPVALNIGEIGDIAMQLDPADINRLLTINFIP